MNNIMKKYILNVKELFKVIGVTVTVDKTYFLFIIKFILNLS